MYNRIDLPLTPSRVTGLVAAAPWLLLSLALLIAAGYSTPWLVVAIPLALTGSWNRWHRCGSLRHPGAVVRVGTQGRRLFITRADQTTREARPLPESRLSGSFLYLAVQEIDSGKRLPVVLLSRNADGNASPEELRRFRTWLRLMPGREAPIKEPAPHKNALQRLWKNHDH